ncbi:hypothetical protein VPH35_138746 [Triticum aestivum]
MREFTKLHWRLRARRHGNLEQSPPPCDHQRLAPPPLRPSPFKTMPSVLRPREHSPHGPFQPSTAGPFQWLPTSSSFADGRSPSSVGRSQSSSFADREVRDDGFGRLTHAKPAAASPTSMHLMSRRHKRRRWHEDLTARAWRGEGMLRTWCSGCKCNSD